MNHQSKKLGFGCIVAVLGLLIGGTGMARAQQTSDVTPSSAAQSLSCLTRPERPLEYPAKLESQFGSSFMRVQLHFSSADDAPRVEVLSSSAAPELQALVFRHLRGYRLPCLQPVDGVVQAVQEFDFVNSAREPLPVELESRKALCVVMPREPIQALRLHRSGPQHVVVVANFTGDGQQQPEVTLIHSSAEPRVEALVRARVASYRMPCRNSGDPLQALRQQFTIRPSDESRHALKREVFSLREFLGMTVKPDELRAQFDFNTMACPFKVNYTSYSPSLPNEVSAGKRDPNRLAFLRWLRERQLAFKDERQANDLFGSVLQIQVPCGSLDLQEAQVASRKDAS